MELRLYIQMLKRGWWIILLTMLTALAGALVTSYLATPKYEAIGRLIVSPSADLINQSDIVDSLNVLNNQSIVSTFLEVISSDRIYTDTLASLGLQPQDIKDNYTYKATALTNSSVIEVSVVGPDPNLAAHLANTLGRETIRFVSGLNNVYTVEFLDNAVPPVLPSSPRPLLNSGLAIVLGLIVGIVLVILIKQVRLPVEIVRQRSNLNKMPSVYDRRDFSHRVEDELAQKPDEVLSIGIVELFGIRDLVETFPVAYLQRVFQSVTDTLQKELRGSDIIGRWNSISLIVMLPNTPGMAANRIFWRIFRSLSQPVDLGPDMVLNLDVHIGGAEYGNNITAQELYERANSAIEQARQKSDIPVYIWEIKNPFITANKADMSNHGFLTSR
jgi:diguanylate cyclase (GGDEF)-like protein